MKKQYLKRLVAISLISTSILAVAPIKTFAAWKQDNVGWWYTEGNQYATGWRSINGEWYYFDGNGYMKTGWVQYQGKWYYLYSSGAMAKSTTIGSYSVDSNGVWIQKNDGTTGNTAATASTNNSTIITSTNADSESQKISGVTGIKFNDVTKIVFYDGRGGKSITIGDKEKVKEFMGYLDGYIIKKATNVEASDGYIHSAHFYINDKDVMDITFVNPIIINNNYYNVIKGELDTYKIDKYLKSIDSSYVTTSEWNDTYKNQ
ncbi:cell wall-binding protein [Clostridium beijerinckii]|uniref:Cell wall-binding protein n=1 Tax=Clostridium beijerinckii TaxID=1520 RepID=A0AAW3WC37_CLOBE|nr:cell wall-binding protein [Clostridium beijerinckii]MBC2476266.1 cell wall-binding protein [Clostridium beijerinckii]NOV61506.1 hypothetical protein [Clostridium beijerinckii]NOV68999.1 hypothetical protein [Clostridium beijerinckii]NOW32624.1 hypothetical protein [Clostridium beijerinckii]